IIVNQSLPNHSAAPGFIDTSFREWTFWLLDTNPLIDSMVNLRAEPFGQRGGDPSQRFSSTAFGDPFTPLPRAYPGDPVVIRTIRPPQAQPAARARRLHRSTRST